VIGDDEQGPIIQELSGWTVYDDANNNGKLDPGELATTTNASGVYMFTDVPAGNYKIREIVPTGWKQITPSNNYGWTFTLSAGESATGINFGVIPTTGVTTGASISGTVFNDVNGDGIDDNGETGLSGWTIYDDANNNGKLDPGELSTKTNASGLYTFTGLTAGNYKIRAIIPTGWKQTTPAKGYGWTVTLSTDQVLTGKSFGAQTTGSTTTAKGASASGIVFNDANGDKEQDDGETGLSGWTVYIDLNNTGALTSADPTTTTNTSGDYDFTDLTAGSYIIRVNRPSGWTQTTPTNNYGQHTTLSSNENATGLSFGEQS
jgi:hypothetical protein